MRELIASIDLEMITVYTRDHEYVYVCIHVSLGPGGQHICMYIQKELLSLNLRSKYYAYGT